MCISREKPLVAIRHVHWPCYSRLLGSARTVLESQRAFRQVRRESTRYCLQVGSCPRVGELYSVRFSMGISVRTGRYTAYIGFELGRSGYLCPGSRRSRMVAQSIGAEWSQDVELKQGHKLVESGPYRFMRHPIYTGHLLMGLGTAIASGRVIALAGLLSFVAGFWIKLNQEERLLMFAFPDEYPGYKARVKALIPYLF